MKSLDCELHLGAVFGLLFALFCVPASLAQGLEFSSDDTVTVSAKRAWEADELDVIHFSGGFVLRAPDWSLEGDSAVVYGKLDDPDKIVVKGKPAKISFLRQESPEDSAAGRDKTKKEERVDGTASLVEYFRASDSLTMRGNATLTRTDSVLVSESIEYDVEADRYSAGGQGGVNLQFTPDDD
jgi:lipopolysaccharide transport protein LptA